MSTRQPRARRMFHTLALGIGLLSMGTGAPALGQPAEPVTVQFLTVSDWNGQVDPMVVGATQVGGAAVLSSYFQADRAGNPATLTLTGGDAFGATPIISSLFDDTPAVEAMRLMGFTADTFGHHNFDRGVASLQALVDLAGSAAGAGTQFSYVAANLTNLAENLTGVGTFRVVEVGGVKVAIIGLVNPDAAMFVQPGHFGTLTVSDPVAAANRARAAARREGAKVFVLLAHLGVRSIDAGGVAQGPLIDLANAVGGFDLIVGGETDIEYAGVHNGALVVENRSRGLTYGRIALTVDPRNGRLIERSVTSVTPFGASVVPDPAVAALLGGYRAQLPALLSAVIGSSTREIPRSDACGRADGRLCESLVGDVTTDALRARYGTDVAITNSGGLRSAMTCPTVDNVSDLCPAYTPPPYLITRGQVLSVLPFGNVAVTGVVTGQELKNILENGVSAMPGANGRFPQVSGLCFTYDIAAPAGSRVLGAVRQAPDGSCTGAPMDLTAAATYSLTMNDFMVTGGDGYPVLRERFVDRDIMEQVAAEHMAATSPLSPVIQGRIACTITGGGVCPVIVAAP